jgi:hypothetical protein
MRDYDYFYSNVGAFVDTEDENIQSFSLMLIDFVRY